jgi:hypothetical protein
MISCVMVYKALSHVTHTRELSPAAALVTSNKRTLLSGQPPYISRSKFILAVLRFLRCIFPYIMV